MIDIWKDIGASTIAKELTAMNCKTKLGKEKWHESSIRKILNNVKYKGDVLLGLTYTIDPISHKRKVNMGEEDKYYMKNHHEPIIEEEKWNRVQEIIKKRLEDKGLIGIKEGYFNARYAFSNSMECAFCGSLVTRKKWGKNKIGWQCKSSFKKGKRECQHSKAIPQNVLEQAFIEVQKKLLAGNHQIIDSFFDKVEKAIKKSNTFEMVGKLKEKERNLQAQRRKLLDMSLNDIITEDEYLIKKEQIEKKISEVNKSINKNVGVVKIEDKLKNRISNMKNNIERQQEIINDFDEDAFKCLVKKVLIGEEDEFGYHPYTLSFILNSTEDDYVDEQLEDFKDLISEFDCKVNFQVFDVDNGFRERRIINNIKVKIYSDVVANMDMFTQ